jgi:1-acyl-sn-glycerol-3-phosphate acyltransferase
LNLDGIKAKIVAADHKWGPIVYKIPVRFGYGAVVHIVRMLFWLLFGVRVYGRHLVPRQGRLLIVANHMSNLDPPLIASMVPREMHFAAKIQLFKGPLGVLITYANAMPIRRSGSDKDAIKRLVGSLKDGNALIMFPEGTRQGKDGGPTKAGPGMVAALAKANVLPVQIVGTHDMKEAFRNRGTLTLRFGEPIPFQQAMDAARARLPEDAPKKDIYHAFSDVVMECVRSL